jgi:hypothetical protein
MVSLKSNSIGGLTAAADLSTYTLLAGAPDTTHRLITTSAGFQLQRT